MKPLRADALLLLVCIILALSTFMQPAAVFAQSETNLNNGVRGTEFGRNQEMENILEILATNPKIDWAAASKQRVRGFAVTYKDRISSVQAEIQQLRSALEGIGETNSDGSVAPNQALTEIIALKQKKELELAELRLLLLMTKEVIEKLDNYLQDQETKSLYTRGDPLWVLAQNMSFDTIVSELQVIAVYKSPKSTLLYPAVVITTIWLLAFFAKSREFILQNSITNNISVRLLIHHLNSLSTWKRLMVLCLCVLAILLRSLTPGPLLHPGIALLIIFLFYGYIITVLSRIVMSRLIDKKHSVGSSLRYRNILTILFGALAALLITLSSVSGAFGDKLTYMPLINGTVYLIWFILFSSLGKSQHGSHTQTRDLIRILFACISLILFCLELLGFQNLSSHIAYTAGFTLVTLAMSILLYDSIDTVIAFFRTCTSHFLMNIGMTESEPEKRSKTHKIISLGMKLYLITGTTVIVLHNWGMTRVDNDQLLDVFLHGIPWFGITLSPVRVTIALLIIIICWPMVAYLQKLMEGNWLKAEDFSSSSRDSILTISGYLCYGAIILISLSIAGIKMTGLAVIIGALSVGIGFGLQNIVNNFISGLILMFERPIKKGDWILVGSTEGYVKKISIRSTIVQTFDRSDVIIPNSELISNQVTNMMFDDSRGRLRVSVGVAYGTDTELVRMILIDAAKQHPQVITDGSNPEPRAWFQAFGESSLNFDLLCHLKDIDMKVHVRSELNTAINRAFKENGIEIPFPQHDVHIISAQP